MQSCLQHLLQYILGECFTQQKYQGFFLKQANVQEARSTSHHSPRQAAFPVREQRPFCRLWSKSSSHSFKCFCHPMTRAEHSKYKGKKKEKYTDSHIAVEVTRPKHTKGHNQPYPSDIQPAPQTLGASVGRGRNQLCSHCNSCSSLLLIAPNYCPASTPSMEVRLGKEV